MGQLNQKLCKVQLFLNVFFVMLKCLKTNGKVLFLFFFCKPLFLFYFPLAYFFISLSFLSDVLLVHENTSKHRHRVQIQWLIENKNALRQNKGDITISEVKFSSVKLGSEVSKIFSIFNESSFKEYRLMSIESFPVKNEIKISDREGIYAGVYFLFFICFLVCFSFFLSFPS